MTALNKALFYFAAIGLLACRLTFANEVVLFEWDVIEGAESYHIEISEKKDFSKLFKSLDLVDTSKEFALPFSRTFYWRIAGKNFLGDLGEWSEIGEVVTLTPRPAIVEKKNKDKKDAPKEEAPVKPVAKVKQGPSFKARYPAWMRAGLSSALTWQDASGTALNVSGNGFTFSRMHLAGAFKSGIVETEIRAQYQRVYFNVQNSSIPSLQETLSSDIFKVNLLSRGIWAPFQFPTSIGVSYQQRPNFIRKLGETLGLEQIHALSFQMGVSRTIKLESPWYLKWEVLGDVAPIGQWRQVGLFAEAVLGHSFAKGSFSPELVVGLNPTFYTVTPYVDRGISIDFSIGLVFKWNFGLGGKVTVPGPEGLGSITQ